MCEAVLKATLGEVNTQMCSTNSITDAMLPALSREECKALCTYADVTLTLLLASKEGRQSKSSWKRFCNIYCFLFSRCQVEANLSLVCVSVVSMNELDVFVSSSCEFADAD